MNIQTVRTPSFTMEYVRFGSGEKHFVILPGLSVQSVLISAQAVAAAYKSFAQDYTVYLFTAGTTFRLDTRSMIWRRTLPLR